MKFSKKLAVIFCLMFLAVITIQSIAPENHTVISFAEAAGKIKISKNKLTLKQGQEYALKITGTTKKVKWSTSDKKVASVSSRGVVTAKSKGTATITAKVSGKKLTCKVTVKERILWAEVTKLELEENEDTSITVTYTEAGTIHWDSSDEDIVTCEWSKEWTNNNNDTLLYIYAHKPGTATIRISVKPQNKSIKLKVTVKKSTKWNSDSCNEMLELMETANGYITKAVGYVTSALSDNTEQNELYARTEMASACVEIRKCIDYAAARDDLYGEDGASMKKLLQEALDLGLSIDSSTTGFDLMNAIMDVMSKFNDAVTVLAVNAASLAD